MGKLVYIDSRAALAAVERSTGDRIVTDVSPLAAVPGLAGQVEDIERLLDQETANGLGDTAIRLSLAVDEVLCGSDLAKQIGLIAEHCQTAGGLSRVAGGLLHRASVMARALDRAPVDPVCLVTTSTPWLSPTAPLLPVRYANPFPSLAEHGFFGARAVEVRTVEPTPQATDVPSGEVVGVRRLLHWPALMIACESLERLGVMRFAPTWRGTLVIGHENETLREALPWLALRGFRLQRVGRRFSVSQKSPPALPEIEAMIEASLRPVISPYLDPHREFDTPAKTAIVTLLLRQLSAGLVSAAAGLPVLRERVASTWRSIAGPRVYLTGGLFGLPGAQLYAALHQAGVHVIDFEHGFTTGLSEHSQRKIHFSEASTADTVLLCSENAACCFSSARRADRVERVVVGLATQTARLLRKPLQRRSARRALGLDANTPIVMHVSTWLPSGNMRPGYGTPTESFAVDSDRLLIEQAYAGLDKVVVFKRYPTQRFPDDPPLAERVRVPPNLVFAPVEDLRYLRAAADILVTASPTSTLGWVAGTGVPVVWLASRLVNPVIEPPWDRIVRNAYLTVDIDRPDWPQRLHELLREPVAALHGRWQERADVRADLHKRAIIGPDGRQGRRPAAAVAAVVSTLEQRGHRLGSAASSSRPSPSQINVI